MAPGPAPASGNGEESRIAAAKRFSADLALDDTPYRSYREQDGTTTRTFGVLIPQGYKKHDDARNPYICPIRSCRITNPTPSGLGSHFNNAHRGACLNDNLDGTLSEVGTYANQATDGLRNGGVPIPAIIVSKGYTSFDSSPMATPTMVQKRNGTRGPLTIQPANEVTESDSSSDEEYNVLGTFKHALLPIGYAPLENRFPEYPWICPLRSCQRLYSTRAHLDWHWREQHPPCLLNDNMDGTLSIVTDPAALSSDTANSGQSHFGIVSRNPNSSEPITPMQHKVYPEGRHRSKNNRGRWVNISEETTTRDSRARQDEEPQDTGHEAAPLISPPHSVPQLERDPHGTWAHICSDLPHNASIPNGNAFDFLLQLPRLRLLELTRKIETYLEERQLIAMIIYVVGVERRNACIQCRQGDTPFKRCVTLAGSNAAAIYNKGYVLRGQAYSCSRCLFRCISRDPIGPCSLQCAPGKDGVAVWDSKRRTSPQRPKENLVTEVPEEGGEMSRIPPGTKRAAAKRAAEKWCFDLAIGNKFNHDFGSLPRKRRRHTTARRANGPERTFVVDTDHESDEETVGMDEPDEDSESDDTATEQEAEDMGTRQRIVTIKIPDRIRPMVARLFGGSPTPDTDSEQAENTDSDTDSDRNQSQAGPLELEPWELEAQRASGYSAVGPTGVTIATRLRVGDTIHFSDNFSMSCHTVPSGETHRFAAEATKTRICTVISGKLQVRLLGSDLAVGQLGVFRVGPGEACSAENRCYVDSIINVVSHTEI
ncbi:hypothetical protein B0T16DRAFT_418407 [Cercophora newfieldiana]|uniref:C2H2-type domain-containing protein n=1 Tax=Cercophora newfieldiana TaxID=92897 RepID=A0AA39XV87_9PEZI|nr:hypothetical protein B0T16DRAFT_418407 [Cercophora newfieldiana]